MTTQVGSPAQDRMFRTILTELSGLGYSSDLIKENYHFPDYFTEELIPVTARAVAFGQLPPDYDTACFAILLSNGDAGVNLISKYRSLGAPRAFEVRPDGIIHWRVSARPSERDQQQIIKPDELARAFRDNSNQWN